MKKSLYRQVMFVLLMICLMLLIAIAIKIEVFKGLSTCVVFKTIVSIMKNSYVSSILCSILAVLIIYITQVYHSKKMLKKDFRCNEIIEDVYDGIEIYCKLKDEIPEKVERMPDEDVLDKRRRESLMFYEFYKKNSGDVDIITLSLSYENNDLLIDSVQSCFLINLNFKLLSIVNNIKNRLPNLRKNYPEIKELYKKYELEKNEKELNDLGNRLSTYFTDLRFMAMYWNELLDYLGYDPTYIKMFIKIYNSKYDTMEDIKQPAEVRNLRAKEVDKAVRKAIWQYKIKHFWDK